MAQNFDHFSQSDLTRMMQKPEAQALLTRLRQLDSSALQRAVQQAMRGNTEGAKELLSPLMRDPDVQDLAGKMRDSNGRV